MTGTNVPHHSSIMSKRYCKRFQRNVHYLNKPFGSCRLASRKFVSFDSTVHTIVLRVSWLAVQERFCCWVLDKGSLAYRLGHATAIAQWWCSPSQTESGDENDATAADRLCLQAGDGRLNCLGVDATNPIPWLLLLTPANSNKCISRVGIRNASKET